MAEAHPPIPILCLSEEALAHAQANNTAQIGYDPSEYGALLKLAGRAHIPPAAIAIGGAFNGVDHRLSYNPNQTYRIAISPDNTNGRLHNQLPQFEPTPEQLANMITLPIPERWTTADLSQMAATGLYRHRSIWKFIASTSLLPGVVASIAGGVATPFLHKAGHDVSYKNMMVGLGCAFSGIGLIIGGVINLSQGNRFAKVKQQARQYQPFPVRGNDDRLR